MKKLLDTLQWPLWLAGVILTFGIVEAWDIETGRPTLSLWTATVASKWPLFMVVYGMLFGGLAVHFFWHWAPTGLPTFGG